MQQTDRPACPANRPTKSGLRGLLPLSTAPVAQRIHRRVTDRPHSHRAGKTALDYCRSGHSREIARENPLRFFRKQRMAPPSARREARSIVRRDASRQARARLARPCGSTACAPSARLGLAKTLIARAIAARGAAGGTLNRTKTSANTALFAGNHSETKVNLIAIARRQYRLRNHTPGPGMHASIVLSTVTGQTLLLAVVAVAALTVIAILARRLSEQNTRLSNAIDNMSQGLCMFDAQGRIVAGQSPLYRHVQAVAGDRAAGLHAA